MPKLFYRLHKLISRTSDSGDGPHFDLQGFTERAKRRATALQYSQGPMRTAYLAQITELHMQGRITLQDMQEQHYRYENGLPFTI